ncbi:MAG TPA: hypothetical protein V6C86_25650 [Oculatellaceae cyanobacterium]
MLKLITSQLEFEELVNRTSWHDAYLRAVHYAAQRYQLDDGSTIHRSGSLVQILLACPMERNVLELAAFELKSLSVKPELDLECPKSAAIQRRMTEADFGGFELICGCIGFRKLPENAASELLSFSEESIYNGSDLAPPYNIDWRAALDASLH